MIEPKIATTSASSRAKIRLSAPQPATQATITMPISSTGRIPTPAPASQEPSLRPVPVRRKRTSTARTTLRPGPSPAPARPRAASSALWLVPASSCQSPRTKIVPELSSRSSAQEAEVIR